MVSVQDVEMNKREEHLTCPACGSTALYRFGFSPAGRQKYLCLICSRQFVLNPGRMQYPNKPICRACGSVMYLYKNNEGGISFRCSGYPVCRNYRKESFVHESSVFPQRF